MKKYILYILMVMISFGCITCRKKEADIKYPLDQEFLEYFGSYKTGSWWVFEEPGINGYRDSVWISYYNRSSMVESGKEIIDFKMTHSFSNSMLYTFNFTIRQNDKNSVSIHAFFNLPGEDDFSKIDNKLFASGSSSITKADTFDRYGFKIYDVIGLYLYTYKHTMFFSRNEGLSGLIIEKSGKEHFLYRKNYHIIK